MGYGGTNQTPMENMPSQAAIASQQAHDDGVNPYTCQPVAQSPNQETGYFTGAVVGASREPAREEEVGGFVDGAPLPLNETSQSHADVEAAEASRSNATDKNGENYVNGTPIEARMNLSALTASNIPRSETQRELALQVVPEANAAEHTTRAGASMENGGRPDWNTDDRTESTATISNLHIPGKFPRSSGVA
jgi:hypothetical protein